MRLCLGLIYAQWFVKLALIAGAEDMQVDIREAWGKEASASLASEGNPAASQASSEAAACRVDSPAASPTSSVASVALAQMEGAVRKPRVAQGPEVASGPCVQAPLPAVVAPQPERQPSIR